MSSTTEVLKISYRTEVKNELVFTLVRFCLPAFLISFPLLYVAFYYRLDDTKIMLSIVVGAVLPIVVGTVCYLPFSKVLNQISLLLGMLITCGLLFTTSDLLLKTAGSSFWNYTGEVVHGSGVFSVIVLIFAFLGDVEQYNND